MTWTENDQKKRPVTFGKIFGLFSLYWNYCLQRRRQELNEIEFFTLAKCTYDKLASGWFKFKWDIQELNWICLAMEDNDNNILNPNNFLTDCFAYLDHLKTCYYLNKNDE